MPKYTITTCKMARQRKTLATTMLQRIKDYADVLTKGLVRNNGWTTKEVE